MIKVHTNITRLKINFQLCILFDPPLQAAHVCTKNTLDSNLGCYCVLLRCYVIARVTAEACVGGLVLAETIDRRAPSRPAGWFGVNTVHPQWKAYFVLYFVFHGKILRIRLGNDRFGFIFITLERKCNFL